jgi:hypothetical protein
MTSQPVGPSEMEALLARLEDRIGLRNLDEGDYLRLIDEAAAAIRQLIAERDNVQQASDRNWEGYQRLAAQLAEAQGQIARLREAMKWWVGMWEGTSDYNEREAGMTKLRDVLAATAPQEPTP